jgi:hypothetical protein
VTTKNLRSLRLVYGRRPHNFWRPVIHNGSVRGHERVTRKEVAVLLILAAVVAVLWLLGFLTLHTPFIHLIILVALVLLVLHFVRGRRTPV